LWVKSGKGRIEHITSGSRPIADIGPLLRRNPTRLPRPVTLCLNAPMPVLTRCRDPERDCWRIHYGDVRVGAIAGCTANPGVEPPL